MYPFDYHRPASRADAVARAQGEARFLAGGQSLVQAMKLRLSSSERLVDLGGIADLAGIQADGSQVTIGAIQRGERASRSSSVSGAGPRFSVMRVSAIGATALTVTP